VPRRLVFGHCAGVLDLQQARTCDVDLLGVDDIDAATGVGFDDAGAVAETIDTLLMGTVRASDLQGVLRDRAKARVTPASEGR